MAGHAQLKFVMTECSKTQIRLTGPIYIYFNALNSFSGYGHLSPSTSGGQAFFIFYAIVGIPLCVTMLIGIGERLSRPYKSLERSRDFTRYHKAEKLVKMILFTLLYFVLFSIIPAIIIMQFEEWYFLESWYYTIVTLTTVGFGDYVPGTLHLDFEKKKRS